MRREGLGWQETRRSWMSGSYLGSACGQTSLLLRYPGTCQGPEDRLGRWGGIRTCDALSQHIPGPIWPSCRIQSAVPSQARCLFVRRLPCSIWTVIRLSTGWTGRSGPNKPRLGQHGQIPVPQALRSTSKRSVTR